MLTAILLVSFIVTNNLHSKKSPRYEVSDTLLTSRSMQQFTCKVAQELTIKDKGKLFSHLFTFFLLNKIVFSLWLQIKYENERDWGGLQYKNDVLEYLLGVKKTRFWSLLWCLVQSQNVHSGSSYGSFQGTEPKTMTGNNVLFTIGNIQGSKNFPATPPKQGLDTWWEFFTKFLTSTSLLFTWETPGLDHQPLFRKGARAPPPRTRTRHEGAAEIEPRKPPGREYFAIFLNMVFCD